MAQPIATTSEWLASHPPKDDRLSQTLAGLAHRIGEDEDDLRLLARELGLERADQVLAVAERTFGDRLDPAARFFVEQIFNPE